MISLMINRDRWNELPKHYQAVLRDAAAETHQWMQAKYDYENPQALKRLVAAGAQLRPFSNEIMEASFKAAEETYAEIMGKNETFKKIYESQMSYRDDASVWWQAGELAYDVQIARAQRAARR